MNALFLRIPHDGYHLVNRSKMISHILGITYSMMALKTLLAHTLRRCRITADIYKTEFKFNVTLKPVSGHFITIEKRLN